MKKNLIIFTALISLAACKASKESSAVEPAGNGVTTKEAAETTADESSIAQVNKYRLIISFISIGEGTDRNARPSLDRIVNEWETKSGKKISIDEYPWGREGEVDYCFKLVELNSSDQINFVAQIREAFKTSALIQITENQACPHKR